MRVVYFRSISVPVYSLTLCFPLASLWLTMLPSVGASVYLSLRRWSLLYVYARQVFVETFVGLLNLLPCLYRAARDNVSDLPRFYLGISVDKLYIDQPSPVSLSLSVGCLFFSCYDTYAITKCKKCSCGFLYILLQKKRIIHTSINTIHNIHKSTHE